ncbi:MAG TPA: hypothetical protein VFR87_08040 [Nocardioidaceae bacterium]|nr:hypothetical protein [Nocardioidaceae bacterium]
MATLDAIRREHVVKAIEEYDALGAEEFLSRYGFRTARDYVLVYDGRSYDSKAVVAVAHGYATGRPLSYDELRGGKDGAAKVLWDLGFEVTVSERPAKARYTNAATVGTEHARETWALAARERLIETATAYHAVITYQELADFVQERSLVRTSQHMRYWIGDVLGRVARDCTQKGEPILSALCVNAHGSVGETYATALLTYRGESVGDVDEHAARERLECYRHFGAELPPGGGVPAMAPQQVRRTQVRTSTPKTPKPKAPKPKTPKAKPAAQPEKQAAFCPVHFTQLPATGVCDLCE